MVELRAHLQQWDSTPLRELLQLVPLYAAAHAAPRNDHFIWALFKALCATTELQARQLCEAMQQQEQPSGDSRHGVSAPVLSSAVLDEMLLLTLHSLQRLQQLQATTSTTTRPSSATTAKRFFSSSAYQVECLQDTERCMGRMFFSTLLTS